MQSRRDLPAADSRATARRLGALSDLLRHRPSNYVRVPEAHNEGGVIEAPTLFTSCWKHRELANLACQPVQISRGRPRGNPGFRYRVAHELAPNDEAWNTNDWDGFTAAYRSQLEALGVGAIVGQLARISEEAGGQPLVLLCFERDVEDCHRGLLGKWLRERGAEVRELANGDLPYREDIAEMQLFNPDRREDS